MNRSKLTRIVAAIAGVSALTLGGMTAADAKVASNDVPSFKKFERSTYRAADGQYLVNGDEPIGSTHSLREFYRGVTGKTAKANRHRAHGLIVNRVSGRDDRWSSTTARNLTYCVSNYFGSSKTAIVNAMAQGAAMWESSSSRVNFVYVPSQDANCRTSNNTVLFSVEPVQTSQYIARAFFPSTSDYQRNVLVDDSIFTSGWAPGNVLGHELGHTLGFRHEHTRPEAGTCFEDNNWRALTGYDSASIMHYPQCNGTSSDLRFSATDGTGVRALYGS
ncbi:matrixin family metalloprotease [uncultured Nocardioides sp.]|uniref:Bacterial leucyl aminopeptidase n=1 Tax=uncultured Nocardioides sp. TaxID=198441 RepID=A0A6J4P054_9ACTN|nr:M57 family metalloprotease [uncultured Nocardioides sp.]CAA9398864.1 MAG: Bacterial leucyl aminopeptidase [uncultured Nocardioides sp.]